MSVLSDIGAAAKALNAAVQELRPAILTICRMASDLLRADEANPGEVKQLLDKGDAALDGVARLEEKATAVLGHSGELIEKTTTIVTNLRDGAWVEVKDLSFGGEMKIEGRLRIVKGD